MQLPNRRTADEIESELLTRYGTVIGGSSLRGLLGYKTGGAFRQAAYCGRLPVPTFFIEGRRGRHALAQDIAAWLASLSTRYEGESTT